MQLETASVHPWVRLGVYPRTLAWPLLEAVWIRPWLTVERQKAIIPNNEKYIKLESSELLGRIRNLRLFAIYSISFLFLTIPIHSALSFFKCFLVFFFNVQFSLKPLKSFSILHHRSPFFADISKHLQIYRADPTAGPCQLAGLPLSLVDSLQLFDLIAVSGIPIMLLWLPQCIFGQSARSILVEILI